MNILILDTGREWGGGTNSLLELLKRIDRDKFRFQVLFYHNYARGKGSDIKTAIEDLGIEFLLLPQKKQSPGVKILKETARALFFFSRELKKQAVFFIDRRTRIMNNAKRITAILKERKSELLYMNNQPSSNLEGIIASKMSGVPAIQHSRIETELNPFEVKAANQGLSKIICVSQGVMDTLVERGVESAKCVVAYNGISSETVTRRSPDEIKSEWGIPEGDLLIGTVGSLIRRKRIRDLIEAIGMIEGKTGCSVKCLIVGEGPERENLVELAEKSGLGNRVIFTGFQSDAISYINAMDIFAMPSEKEGFPRVVLEAMLMRKPVVAARIRGTEELVVDNETGIMYKKGAVKDLAGCLAKLLLSPQLREDMGMAGKERVVDNFFIERYVEQVSNILSGGNA
ncbi:putative glycosyltransferase EpsD [bacterium BMS3Bbin09]|nr:putative glycosyltransferase EpsD [bacterium BMS3Bbin09]